MFRNIPDDVLNIILVFEFVALFGIMSWYFHRCWQNRASQWKIVATIDGIIYRQHIKYPKRRIWEYVPARGRLKVDWLDSKTDTLDA